MPWLVCGRSNGKLAQPGHLGASPALLCHSTTRRGRSDIRVDFVAESFRNATPVRRGIRRASAPEFMLALAPWEGTASRAAPVATKVFSQAWMAFSHAVRTAHASSTCAEERGRTKYTQRAAHSSRPWFRSPKFASASDLGYLGFCPVRSLDPSIHVRRSDFRVSGWCPTRSDR